MDCVFELYVTRNTITTQKFLHLTFQEFLAAVYISMVGKSQRLERHHEGRSRLVWLG